MTNIITGYVVCPLLPLTRNAFIVYPTEEEALFWRKVKEEEQD